jgi:hypothetical protein
MDIEIMYNELINSSQAVSILAENALQQYPENELGGQLAQSTLELIDRLDELNEWVSAGGALPGQIREVQQTATATIHIANAMDFIAQRFEVHWEDDDDDDDNFFPGKYKMSITYGVVTEESAAEGDYAETGYKVEDEIYDSLDELLDDVKHDHSWLEWSSSHPTTGDWVVSQDEEDYATGDHTSYNLHIENMETEELSEPEIAFITNELALY